MLTALALTPFAEVPLLIASPGRAGQVAIATGRFVQIACTLAQGAPQRPIRQVVCDPPPLPGGRAPRADLRTRRKAETARAPHDHRHRRRRLPLEGVGSQRRTLLPQCNEEQHGSHRTGGPASNNNLGRSTFWASSAAHIHNVTPRPTRQQLGLKHSPQQTVTKFHGKALGEALESQQQPSFAHQFTSCFTCRPS